MSDARNQMIAALKAAVLPAWRNRGFAGSFPHLRRDRGDQIDLITFQFDRNGGGFVIELGQCKPEDFTTTLGRLTSREKVRAWDAPLRTRIQPQPGSSPQDWFRFRYATTPDAFLEIATSVLSFTEAIENLFQRFDPEAVAAHEKQLFDPVTPPCPPVDPIQIPLL
ncbi:DUF4304 domain-containing protein [Chthoniobacter flavus]|uniref:DUF4304 domain-containing protein n=1 Tax=Chthoniobacter flavus TaxID=191863 RepID=UPI00104E7183|nr:DUF4304 domain-containing protein [Chthoniobacter flavus]